MRAELRSSISRAACTSAVAGGRRRLDRRRGVLDPDHRDQRLEEPHLCGWADAEHRRLRRAGGRDAAAYARGRLRLGALRVRRSRDASRTRMFGDQVPPDQATIRAALRNGGYDGALVSTLKGVSERSLVAPGRGLGRRLLRRLLGPGRAGVRGDRSVREVRDDALGSEQRKDGLVDDHADREPDLRKGLRLEPDEDGRAVDGEGGPLAHGPTRVAQRRAGSSRNIAAP